MKNQVLLLEEALVRGGYICSEVLTLTQSESRVLPLPFMSASGTGGWGESCQGLTGFLTEDGAAAGFKGV